MKIPNLVDVLFDALNVESKDDNPFECEAANKLFDDFCKKYICGVLTDPAVSNDSYLELGGIILEERKNAFKIGFQAALSLLKGE